MCTYIDQCMIEGGVHVYSVCISLCAHGKMGVRMSVCVVSSLCAQCDKVSRCVCV